LLRRDDGTNSLPRQQGLCGFAQPGSTRHWQEDRPVARLRWRSRWHRARWRPARTGCRLRWPPVRQKIGSRPQLYASRTRCHQFSGSSHRTAQLRPSAPILPPRQMSDFSAAEFSACALPPLCRFLTRFLAPANPWSSAPVFRVRFRSFPRGLRRFLRGSESHGDFCAATNFGAICRRLVHSKSAANQNWLESEPQAHFRDVAHRLATEVWNGDVAAFVESNRY